MHAGWQGTKGVVWRGPRSTEPPPGAAALREDVQAELEQLESQLSHWRPASETSQFNSSETTLELEYSSEFVSLVNFGRRLAVATDGTYDITAGPLVNAWGFGPDGPRQREPTDEEIRELLRHVGWDKIEVQQQWQTLRKTHPQVQIDLGSLLQGLAVDRIAALLDEAGVGEYLVEVGGELRSKGTWTVGIVDPLAPDRMVRSLKLTDSALATSGVYRNATDGADAPIHHVVSPQTGRPVQGSWLSCSVIAPTCLEAEGWATALMTTADQDTLRIAEQEKIAAILIDPDGRQVRSAAVASYLRDDSPP